jgi:hypothetical protein
MQLFVKIVKDRVLTFRKRLVQIGIKKGGFCLPVVVILSSNYFLSRDNSTLIFLKNECIYF